MRPHRFIFLSLPAYFLQRKRAFIIFGCLVFIAVSGVLRRFQTKKPTSQIVRWEYDLDIQEPTADPIQFCSLPRIHPFDQSILPYLSQPRPIVCKVRQPFLTFVDDQGWLKYNTSALTESGYGPESLSCTYQFIVRPPQDDFTVTESFSRPLPENGVYLEEDFVSVSCKNYGGFNHVYANIHGHVAPKIHHKPQHEDRFGIFYLGIDSISRMAFIRHLPKTYRYLTEVMGAHVFRGMTKIGDNTFPNLAAMLTGKKVKDEIIVDGDFNTEWPIAWKDFQQAGYATLFAEDQPHIGLFTYLRQGLKDQPTDHYLRPFWLAVEKSGVHRLSSNLCFGNTPKHLLQLNYSKDFLLKYSRRTTPVYGMSFFVELSHDYLCKVSVADEDFASWMEELHSKGIFNRTSLVVFSDHGHRFDSIRETLVGRLEERLPFFAFYTPPDLIKDKPYIAERLKTNTGRLTSLYDAYYTAMDLLRFSTRAGHELGDTYSDRGMSLFGDVPSNRTCAEAGIPDHYCVCEEEETLDTGNDLVQDAANSVITVLNSMLKKSLNDSLCVPLSLKSVRRAERVKVSDKILVNLHDYFGKMVQEKSAKSVMNKLRLVIETIPSNGVFEATVVYRSEEGFTVDQDISRINKYGNHSWCVTDPILRKYCFCRQQMKSKIDRRKNSKPFKHRNRTMYHHNFS